MGRYFRVHPWLHAAQSAKPGHALYVHPYQGSGRVDNPNNYLTLYIADTPAGAVAETWGRHEVWTDELLLNQSLPASVAALSTYEADLAVVDLNDPQELFNLSLRPSRVVTRNVAATQAWALAIHRSRGGDGVRWWSYHEPDWGSLGIWDYSRIRHLDTVALSAAHPAVVEAGRMLNRRWV